MIGNILLISGNDFFAKIIQWYTKSKYNHVALFIDEKNVIESNLLQGVKKIPFQKYKELKQNNKLDYDIYRVKNITEKQINLLIKFAIEQLEKPYDYIQLICIAFLYIFKKLRKLEPIDLSGWVCSELIAESFYQAYIIFSQDVDPDNITPKDIAESPIVEKIN